VRLSYAPADLLSAAHCDGDAGPHLEQQSGEAGRRLTVLMEEILAGCEQLQRSVQIQEAKSMGRTSRAATFDPRGRGVPLPSFSASTYRRINSAEVALVVTIEVVATLVARGVWLF
jgi:hypothetical protein